MCEFAKENLVTCISSESACELTGERNGSMCLDVFSYIMLDDLSVWRRQRRVIQSSGLHIHFTSGRSVVMSQRTWP